MFPFVNPLSRLVATTITTKRNVYCDTIHNFNQELKCLK
ncbi:hypothetical protein VPHK375_0051 [Vibrio phage K375]